MAITLGYQEANYMAVKELIGEFLYAHMGIFEYLGDLKNLIDEIYKDHTPARYQVIYIAAECF